jgi:hypothetical protein
MFSPFLYRAMPPGKQPDPLFQYLPEFLFTARSERAVIALPQRTSVIDRASFSEQRRDLFEDLRDIAECWLPNQWRFAGYLGASTRPDCDPDQRTFKHRLICDIRVPGRFQQAVPCLAERKGVPHYG